MKFNIAKYRQWLNNRGMSDAKVNILLELNGMERYEGRELEQLTAEGIIILDQWCDYD